MYGAGIAPQPTGCLRGSGSTRKDPGIRIDRSTPHTLLGTATLSGKLRMRSGAKRSEYESKRGGRKLSTCSESATGGSRGSGSGSKLSERSARKSEWRESKQNESKQRECKQSESKQSESEQRESKQRESERRASE